MTPDFGESREHDPSGVMEWAEYRVVSPFDPTLSPGKRMLVADGGVTRRPVPSESNPSEIVAWDYRAVAPCTAEDAIPILEPSVISPID